MPDQEKEKTPGAVPAAETSVATPPVAGAKAVAAAEEVSSQYFFGEPLVGFDPSEITGSLVVIEGMDGSGKSTQLYLLKRWLEIGGFRLHFTEWNSSPLVRSATRRGKQRRLLTPTTFSLLHAADFADRCERQIMPLLQGDYLVLADRYIYTAFARDVARNCSPRWLRNL